MKEFPPEVIELIGSYVYLYLDPRTHEVFYVGKGIGSRAFSHLNDPADSAKVRRIAEIRGSGHEPVIEILRYGLTESEAALVEASVIDVLRLESLTNVVRGYQAGAFGRTHTSELLIALAAPPAEIKDPVLLVTLNRLYRSNMSDLDLYEATRGKWKIGPRREKAVYACAVYQGVIRETFTIKKWQPAGTDEYASRDDDDYNGKRRWEFVGERAAEDVRLRYNRHSVRELLRRAQNPIRYVNC